jgi:hypothetical protein
MIKNDSGLDAGDAARGIDLENTVHVTGEIEDDRDIAAQACERGSAAAAEKRSAEFAAEGNRGQDIVGIAGKNHANGHLAIIRPVGGIEGAAAVIEANVAANSRAQGFS